MGADTIAPDVWKSTRFDSAQYMELKQRVHQLKNEQQKVVKTQGIVKEAETLALLEQRKQYEESIKQLQEQMSALQLQLRQNNERSSKLRHHHEKEKKAQQAQVDGITKVLEGLEAEHAGKMVGLTAKHDMEVASLKKAMDDLKQQQDAELSAVEAAKEAAIADVDEWCQGEVEAVRVTLGKKLQEAEEGAREWQQRFEKEAEAKQSALENCRELEHQLQVAQEDCIATQQQLAKLQDSSCQSAQQLAHQLESEREQWQQEREQLAMQRHAEVQTVKQKHAQMLDLVDSRVQQIVAKKDATIGSLKTEVAALHAKLRDLEQLVSLGQ